MLESTEEHEGCMALVGDDFPWRVKADHPGDYVEASQAMQPEFIFHRVRGRPSRLWLRLSWKLADNRFTPMSFLLDAGAPRHLYLSSRAISALEQADLTGVEEDTDVQYTTLFGRRCLVEPTPAVQEPANVIGLMLLKRLGMQLHEHAPHFSFNSPPFHFFCSDRVE